MNRRLVTVASDGAVSPGLGGAIQEGSDKLVCGVCGVCWWTFYVTQMQEPGPDESTGDSRLSRNHPHGASPSDPNADGIRRKCFTNDLQGES